MSRTIMFGLVVKVEEDPRELLFARNCGKYPIQAMLQHSRCLSSGLIVWRNRPGSGSYQTACPKDPAASTIMPGSSKCNGPPPHSLRGAGVPSIIQELAS